MRDSRLYTQKLAFFYTQHTLQTDTHVYLEYVCILEPVLKHAVVEAYFKPAPVDHAMGAHNDINMVVPGELLCDKAYTHHVCVRARVCG